MLEIAARTHNSHDHSFRDYSSTLLEKPEQKLHIVLDTSLCFDFGGSISSGSGHLWTSLDLWILRLASSWLRVGQVAGRDGTPQKLGPHLVRSLRGLPHTAKDQSCQEIRSETKYHEMWELWECHENCKCEPIHCDLSGLFL